MSDSLPLTDADPGISALQDRWDRIAVRLCRLGVSDRLILLDVLARCGPLPLGMATHEGGIGCHYARANAVVLRGLGLIVVDMGRGGLNLSAMCSITPAGRALLEALRGLALPLESGDGDSAHDLVSPSRSSQA